MPAIGFINAFDELADRDRRLGRKVANYGLTAALLEYSTVDELHFFMPFYNAGRPFMEHYAPFMDMPHNKERIKLLPALGLPQLLGNNDYLAIHAAELDRYFPEMCHMRNQWGRTPFPISCTPHTLSYWFTQVRNLYKVLPGVREYDSVFCTSQAAKDYLHKQMGKMGGNLRALGLVQAGYQGRLDICPLGVQSRDFAGIEQATALKKLKIAGDMTTMLCLGRLTPFDKFDLAPLIGMLWILNQKQPVRLILAGAENNRYGQSMLQLAEQLGLGDRVHLFADFDSPLKPYLLAACDIFVSPADNVQETFGLSILEAMAAGKPVIASDFSGYRDLVKHGETGFLIPTIRAEETGMLDALWPVLPEHILALQMAQRTAIDMEMWQRQCQTLIEDLNLRQQMGQAGLARVRQYFDWKVVVGRMESLWREMKAEAMAAPARQPEKNVLNLSLKECFGHFMSGSLPIYRRFKPGPMAELFKQGKWGNFPNVDLGGAFNPSLVGTIVDFIKDLGGASLMDLYQAASSELPAYQMEHLCIWALKYGIISQE